MTTFVSFLWHMHQPFYKDVVHNSYVMPWAYLHGAKDYFGMAALAAEFPEVHQTFNLVPSLLMQLEEYARGEANDPMFDLAFKPVDALTDADRGMILQKCFPAPVLTMVQPYPRYFELYERRSDPSRHHEFSDADFRDIQVWWTLAWMDHDHRPADLVQKGRDFSESDKAVLRELVLTTIADIVPEYRRRQDEGIIEISTTPYYHPILPLLINSRVDDGHVPVEIRFPEDAKEQLRRSREFMRDRFGRYPRGLWPSEGSVSDEVALLAASMGFEWMATDEGILAKSGIGVYGDDRPRLFQPYRRDGITIFFRDRGLSDLIGFHYMHSSPRDGADDLVGHLKNIPDGSHVSIILDGENPWDYYPNSGRDFLRFLFDRISNEPSLEAVTLSEACERLTPRPLEWLAPGSWANANFSIWIGHSEDHRAWEWIARARAALMEMKGKLPKGQWERAYEELLVSEGSDWMWWFGNDFSSDSDAIFDSLFRQHIANVYHLIGLTPPKDLEKPIKQSLEGRHLVMPPPPPVAAKADPQGH
jgi:alpha-amylase/alpha-mannosidase (GH57 family)